MTQSEVTEQITTRLPKSMVARIEAHAARLHVTAPGRLRVTRADALRDLIETSLLAAERESPKT
jgi:hypothetical protein